MRVRLFAVIFACLLSSPALANVIYDVTVGYSLAGHTATYTFSMEFATAPPPSKTAADLLSSTPALDITNEKLIVDGVEWPLVIDHSMFLLVFDGSSLVFFSDDAFANPGASSGGSVAQLEGVLDLGSQLGVIVATGLPTVEQRDAAGVPVPGSAWLLTLAYGVLGVGRRAFSRRQVAAS